MTAAAEELVEIVDHDNRPQGGRTRREMRQAGLTHRACYIIVRHGDGRLFTHRRTADKDIYPGCWDIAAGGVVLAGESYEAAARRELDEELGIRGDLEFLFDHYMEGADNRVWGRVYLCRHDGPFTLQESEIAEGRFLSLSEAAHLAEQQPFTPDGLEILEKLIKSDFPGKRATFFLHGLDSSGQGTKGRFFAEHFPHIRRPDFSGGLEERMARLEGLCAGLDDLALIGSSFGGLMATLFARRQPQRVSRLILLAPALNYGNYQPPAEKLAIPATLVIGRDDTVTPPALVLPLAKRTFAHLHIEVAKDDHMLHQTFASLPWHRLLLR